MKKKTSFFIYPINAFLGFFAVVSIILAFGCNNPGDPPSSLVLSNTDLSGTFYKLTISHDGNRAVYSVKVGDVYVLEVTKSGSTKTSTGIINSFTQTADRQIFYTLQPSYSGASTFNVEYSLHSSAKNKLTKIDGTITYDDGTSDIPFNNQSFDGTWDFYFNGPPFGSEVYFGYLEVAGITWDMHTNYYDDGTPIGYSVHNCEGIYVIDYIANQLTIIATHGLDPNNSYSYGPLSPVQITVADFVITPPPPSPPEKFELSNGINDFFIYVDGRYERQ